MKKIKFVKAHVTDNGEGFEYLFFVRYTDCTSQEYIHYDEQGRTICEPYCRELLPFHVRKWLETHDKEYFCKCDDVVVYIYW